MRENFHLLSGKVVAMACERWSLTKDSKLKYSDLTWKLLVCFKTGHLEEVVAAGGSTVIVINTI